MFKLLFNAVLVAILFYLVARYARDLIRAALYDGRPPREVPPPQPPPSSSTAYGPGAYRQQQKQPSRRPTQPPRQDIEDARWEDLP